MPGEADDWLRKADEDMDAAKYLLHGGRANAAAFHAQQASEKALKALIVARDEEPQRTHDLSKLAADVGAPAALEERCSLFGPVYLASRYPDVPGEVGEEQAEDLVALAEEVIAWCRTRS